MINSTSQKAYDYILEQILSGKIPMGDPINELAISEKIGLSRSPIREALKKLEAEGMTVNYPGRGNFAVTLSAQDIEEIFDLRTVFEVAALRRSAGHISDKQLKDTKAMIEKLDPKKNKPKEFYEADRKLHGSFVDYCGNHRMTDYYRTLMMQIELVRRISSRNAVHFEASKEYHLQILDAMIAGDTEKAAATLKKHLDEVMTSTVEVMKYSK